MTTDKTYNGWANYQTWNVALWIQNDEGLYGMAKECRYGVWPWLGATAYDRFQATLATLAELHTPDPAGIAVQTPDGVRWNDSEIDVGAINEMINEL